MQRLRTNVSWYHAAPSAQWMLRYSVRKHAVTIRSDCGASSEIGISVNTFVR